MNYTEKLKYTLEELSEYDEPDSEKILEFLNTAQAFRSFGEGLTDLIIKKYGDMSTNSPDEILKSCAKEKGININRNTIANWFDGLRPKKGEHSREHMFLIAFALGLTYEETCDLFKKVYYDRPFNFRNPREYIYWFCIKSRKTYQSAENMISQINLSSNGCVDQTIGTQIITADLEDISSEREVISYINTHPHNFTINTRSAKKVVDNLIQKIKGRDEEKELLKMGKVDDSCSYIARECNRNEDCLDDFKSLVSTSTMLDIILGINFIKIRKEVGKPLFKNAAFPQEIINRFPTKQTFSKKEPSSEELRKMIILLFSYKFWFEKQYEESETDIDDYIAQMDDTLDSVGLQTLYYGNPFDWLFMYCSMNEYPLDLFRNIIADAFYWE